MEVKNNLSPSSLGIKDQFLYPDWAMDCSLATALALRIISKTISLSSSVRSFNTSNMPFRNDKQMNRCVRPNIFDHHQGLIFIDEIGEFFFPDNHAEGTILFHATCRFTKNTKTNAFNAMLKRA